MVSTLLMDMETQFHNDSFLWQFFLRSIDVVIGPYSNIERNGVGVQIPSWKM